MNHIIHMLVFIILYLLCKVTGKQAVKEQNFYTLNHMHYNMLALSIGIRFNFIYIICLGTQRQLQPEFHGLYDLRFDD